MLPVAGKPVGFFECNVAGNGQKALVDIARDDGMVMHQGIIVICFDGFDLDTGMDTLETVRLIKESGMFCQPGNRILHLPSMAAERFDRIPLANADPDEIVHKRHILAHKVVLVVAAKEDKAVAKHVSQLLNCLENLP